MVGPAGIDESAPIDRRALVDRHAPRIHRADPMEPLTVGNGEFAFTVDVTGLQSLPAFHAAGMPLHTMAQWAWHTAPNPDGYVLDDALEEYRTADGHGARYATTGRPGADGRHERAATWLRENPHRIDLGRIELRLSGEPIRPEHVTDIGQRLDLWQGRVDSNYRLAGVPVRVATACHPVLDAVAIRLSTSLLAAGRLTLGVRFPYASGDWSEPCDWAGPDPLRQPDGRHRTVARIAQHRADIRRELDADVHHVAITWSDGASLRRGEETDDPHAFILRTDAIDAIDTAEVVVGFARDALPADLPSATATFEAAAGHWEDFWRCGAAVEVAGSADPRAGELERRTVLSQYLTAVNCAGTLPPAETGLVTNSWRGKFHLEMHWWHAAHFPLWNRAELLDRSLPWYRRILPLAREYAIGHGCAGARWPKQIGPEGRESPSDVGAFLIWQQPHPIFYAELLYRAAAAGERFAVLERYAELVDATAEFMASYPVLDEARGRFDLGPPLTSAQEKAFRERTASVNPAFELAYWRWGLRCAGRWRERLGRPRVPSWDRVADGLAEPPRRDGRYVELEHPVTGTEGHPTMVGALGFVPSGIGRAAGDIDAEAMRATLRQVLSEWELDDTWGWDYPLLAMTACRLDEPELAVDALLMDSPKNRYLGNGHNVQKLPQLPLYLPGNGGLLYAVAMMAGGWDGAPDRRHPGFSSRTWTVRAEGLHRAP